MDQYWVFRDYLAERGENEIRLWLDGLPKRARIKIDVRLRHLENVRYFQGEPQYIKALVGYDGIYEVRVISQNVQYRPLGCYGPGPGDFTLLVGAVEKGGRLEPREAADVAVKRREIILADRRRTHEHFERDDETEASR
jgi:hypothetical protein